MNVGVRATFTYPNYGIPVGYPEHVAHSSQTCTVIRELGNDERDPEVGQMFIARFADGTELTVHADELDPTEEGPFNADVNPHPDWPIETNCCSFHYPGDPQTAAIAEEDAQALRLCDNCGNEGVIINNDSGRFCSPPCDDAYSLR